jgi:predicted glutamine amidotransferase
MCRFLMLRRESGFDPRPALETFRDRCRRSVEFQGHGFGLAFRARGEWSRYRSLTPIWEDALDALELPRSVDFLIVHARSAFRNEGIAVENNMPFYRGDTSFVFNGELRGVRLRVPGRIGAERVFELVLTRERGDLSQALVSADGLLHRRSRYVRALNMALTDGRKIFAHCRFNESPDYFTLYTVQSDVTGVSSEPLDESFRPMRNGETRVL